MPLNKETETRGQQVKSKRLKYLDLFNLNIVSLMAVILMREFKVLLLRYEG